MSSSSQDRLECADCNADGYTWCDALLTGDLSKIGLEGDTELAAMLLDGLVDAVRL